MRHSVKSETYKRLSLCLHKELYTRAGFTYRESNSGAFDLRGFALIPAQMQQATRCHIVWLYGFAVCLNKS